MYKNPISVNKDLALYPPHPSLQATKPLKHNITTSAHLIAPFILSANTLFDAASKQYHCPYALNRARLRFVYPPLMIKSL